MDKELQLSVENAYKEFKEEPMKHFYDHPIAGYVSRLRVKKILKELGDLNGKKVLDVGCEAGYVSLKILRKNPSHFSAIDVCEEALDEFKDKLKNKNFSSEINLKKGFLQEIPFEEELFDTVVCTEVIEHAPYIEKGFKEMSRVLKKGGKLILTFPNEKQRRKVYPIVSLFGINTDVEEEVTMYEYERKDIIEKLKPYFKISNHYSIPKLFPLTNIIIAEKI